MNKQALEQGRHFTDEDIRSAIGEVSKLLPLRVPVSTYRLQFNRDFTFREASAIVPYLHALGITDIYCSPFFKAREGSAHGYDVVDLNSINPEIGTRDDLDGLVSELRKHGMGLIMDIVPNHMSIGSSENHWWMDVLENGPSSAYAHFFDIDWKPVKEELENKVIIPVLGDQYGQVLDNQELRLSFEGGAFFIDYHEHRLPVEPSTYARILGHRIEVLEELLGGDNPHFQELLSILTAMKHLPPCTVEDPEKVTERQREKEVIKKRLLALYLKCEEFRKFTDENVQIFNGTRHVQGSFDLLDALLYSQVYRLAFWRVATEEINYRRFFDINDLAAIRVEDPEVFREAHRLVFDLIREGKATGLRIDHPDGLHNPTEYFRRLQDECFVQRCLGALGAAGDDELQDRIRRLLGEEGGGPADGLPFYVVGEKILIDDEPIPADWRIFGATGYGFMNSATGVLADSSNVREMDRTYARFARTKEGFRELVYEKKKLIMKTSMSSEINVLGHNLNRISERDRHYRDFTLNNLIDAVVEVIAFFPVYRTYIDASGVRDRDRFYIETAITKARRHSRDLSPSLFDFIREVLLLHYPDKFDEALKGQWLDFTMKFEQLTGPVMAKGLEDTVFYVFNRLASLNEVGGNPDRFGIPVETFHGQNLDRCEHWPHALIATSTHDSKRNGDVRARINVVSELPEEWRQCLARWSRLNKKKKPAVEGQLVPDRNEEYLFYQTLLGVWPFEPLDEAAYGRLKKRVKDYMLKAAREAKVNTNWINPKVEYEEALMDFVEAVMDNRAFVEDFRGFQKKISHCGAFNSLSQALLKITSPGVPDFYQGTEFWSLTLVDPDNRRPVDYALRARTLQGLKDMASRVGPAALARELALNKEDGRAKMYLTYKALNFRKENRELFSGGDYIPLEAAGKYAGHLVAFARGGGDGATITVAPRLLAGLVPADELPLAGLWEGTYVVLPFEGASYRDVFTGATVEPVQYEGRPALPAEEMFSDFPVCLLERQEG